MPYPDKEHLFKPGQSGNPKGRPKGTGIRQWMKIIMEEVDPETKKKQGEILAEKLLKMAKRGHSKSIDVIVEGVDGKLTQPLNIEECNISVTYSKEKDELDKDKG